MGGKWGGQVKILQSSEILTIIRYGKKNLWLWLKDNLYSGKPQSVNYHNKPQGTTRCVWKSHLQPESKYNYLSHHFKLCPGTTSKNNLWKLHILSITTVLWKDGDEDMKRRPSETADSEHWSLKQVMSLAWFPLTDMYITKILPYTYPSMDITYLLKKLMEKIKRTDIKPLHVLNYFAATNSLCLYQF